MSIFGGAQIPDLSTGFFSEHPYVDIIAHGEGEYILKNIFTAIQSKIIRKYNEILLKNPGNTKYSSIDSGDLIFVDILLLLIIVTKSKSLHI